MTKILAILLISAANTDSLNPQELRQLSVQGQMDKYYAAVVKAHTTMLDDAKSGNYESSINYRTKNECDSVAKFLERERFPVSVKEDSISCWVKVSW